MPETAASQRLDRGTVVALVAMGLAVFVIANDFCALSVALPAIEHDLDADVATVQWVINAYALVFGVLIVTGGRLADLFGRRRVFFAGCVIFAGFSVLAGLAPGTAWLIASRAAMGIGAAMMWPAILGMTYAALPAEKAGLAGGLILGAAGFGNAMGPLIGGALTDTVSWRAVFFLNLPVSLLAIYVIWLKVRQPEERSPEAGIDYGGVSTLSIGLVALLLALDQATDYGWSDWRIIALLAASAIFLVAFVAVERRVGVRALVPPDVIANREFSAACLGVLLMSAVFFACLLYLPQFMQKLLGYSPLDAGAGLLPMMALFALVSFAAGPLYQRLGAKLVVSTGAACLFGGMLLLSLVGRDAGYGALVPGMAVVGLGVGLFYSSVTTAGVTALDPSRSSLAGGIVYMFQIAGGAIGLGLTTTVFTSASQSALADSVSSTGIARIPASQLDAVYGILAGTESAQRALAHLAPEAIDRIKDLVRDAFVTGFQHAFRLDTALALGGLVITVAFVGGRLGSRRPAAATGAGERA
ncbi:MAG TPA: DHA2 family efflux MFS transporter permease subunit [Solirubrobacteraceae bacterium]|nr:DHA2 family efflux MFS transporter permease subunit [Solirubrobacteraceae bacterium]